MQVVKGDLIKLALQKDFDVIIHGCNCFCTMGAGIAASIRSEFPEALSDDADTIKGDKSKLGSYSCATVKRNDHTITIINGYTQYRHSGSQSISRIRPFPLPESTSHPQSMCS